MANGVKIWHKAPIINIFFDMLVDSFPAQPSGLNDALTNVGLLAALILTVVFAIPMSVTYDEVMQAMVRYNCTDPLSIYQSCTEYARTHDGPMILSQVANGASWALFLLASCLFGVVIFTIVLKTTGANAFYETPEKYLAWWRWTRFVFLFNIVTLLLGLNYSFRTFSYLYMIKFPDAYIMQYGKSSWSLFGESVVGLSSLLNTSLNAVALSLLMCMSGGLWALHSTKAAPQVPKV